MAIEVRISGTTYKAADDFIIKQQAGAVSMSTVSVLKGSNPIPQPLQSAQILIDGAPVFYGLIASVQDPRRSTGYEPARYTLEIQSIETVLNFRMAKRNWYNKRVDEIVTDIFTDYLAEEGITLGGISTTTVQISAYRKNHSKISEILDELAEKVDGASYYIAPDKKFYFLVRDDFTAIEAPDRVTNMSRSRSYGDLRTVQTVKGASAGILATWTNTALKAAIAALSGTSGKIEAIRDDSTIRNPTAAAMEAADTGARHAENEQTIRCEVEGIAGTDLYTLWDIAPSRTVEGETVPTKWPAEYEGEYVVIERTISGAGGKIQTSLTLRNRNYFARYGYTVRSIAAGNALNNERLGEEFSQDRLTPAKKLVALRNFLEAHDDVTSLDAQADALGILTEKAALDAAYQAIGTYLNAGDPWDGISLPAWLTDEAMTITEEIIGTEYDAIWLNFNLKKNAIREKIAFVTSASNNAYAEAQAALAQTTAQAYADGIVTAAEQAAIDHADDVADAARLAAIAAAALDATSKATAAQAAAEGYAQAQAAAAQTAAEAHADGIVSAEEARAIADAQAKADAARDAAIAAAALDATAKANAAQLLSEDYADAAAQAAETSANAHADGIVSAEEARAIADATAKANAARDAAIAAAAADSTTKSAAAQAAAEAYALAQANLAQTAAQSYADGAVDAEEARAIADAAAKADAAQAAAIAAAQADATSKANAAQAAAEAYAAAQAELARTTAEAYADGIVDAEESRAIADAQAKADAARDAAIAAAAADATAKANAAQAAAEAYTRSATKYLTALTTQGDFQGQLGLFAGRIYRWTGAVWDPQDAIIPTDTPALYLSFDDVPDIPDDPAGVLYRNPSQWFTGLDGWSYFHTAAPSVSNGVMRFSPGGMVRSWGLVSISNNVVVLKIKADTPGYFNLHRYNGSEWVYTYAQIYVTSEYTNVAVIIPNDTCTIWGFDCSTYGYLEEIYIGTGAYLTPAIDNSGGGRHGTIFPGVVSVAGASGKGVRFTKAEQNVAIQGDLSELSDFTMGCFYTPLGNHEHYAGTLLSSGDWNAAHWGFYVTSGNASIGFRINQGAGAASFDANFQFTVGVRYRVDVRHHGGALSIFVDGMRVGHWTDSFSGNLPVNGYTWTGIGRETYAGGYFALNGEMDEVTIFPRALTDSEIRGLYLAKSLPKLYTLSDYQLDQMASDSVITPQEKGQVSTEWTRINGNGSTTGSYWTAKAEAAALSVSYTAAETARSALYAYLYTSPGVLANMDVPTAITPATWRGLWQAYDDAEVALLNAIAAKRAANAEAAATAAAALDATAKANAAKLYADGLSSTLQTQLDRAIVYYTQIGDPSTDWTTQSSRNEHIGDYWRISSIATWRQWSGSAWTDITDPVAQAAATAAQTTANAKSTLWATLPIAQGHAVAGDLFLDASLLYRCTVAGESITLGNSTRLTPKRYDDVADSTARAALTGMILGDRVYQLDTLQWYVYTTSWITDGPALASVPATYAPRFLGRYNASHPGTVHPGDWWVVYDTDDSPIQRGVYYSNAGSSTRISAVSGETGYTTDQTLLSKLSSAMPEVAWAEKNGFGTASDYGISMYFESFGAVTAFILSLFAKEVTLSAAGWLKSHDYAEDGDGFPTNGFILDVLNQAINSYGSTFRNTRIKSAVITDASIDGVLDADEITTSKAIGATFTASGSYLGKAIQDTFNLTPATSFTPAYGTFNGKTVNGIRNTGTTIKSPTGGTLYYVRFSDTTTIEIREYTTYSYSGSISVGVSASVDLLADARAHRLLHCYAIDDDASPLATKSTSTQTDFYTKRPVSCVLLNSDPEGSATLYLKYNNAYHQIAHASSGYTVGVALNPGNYRLLRSGNGTAYLYAVGIYGQAAASYDTIFNS